MVKPPALTAEQLHQLLSAEFPESFNSTSGLAIAKVWHGGAMVRQEFRDGTLRPGGTMSGPTIMALADVAAYVAILAAIGWVPLAVTTSLNINFLKRPKPGPLTAECRLIKLGKRLAVADVSIRSDGEEELVAHATSTYSLPPR